jgi:hypothetical protein
MTTLDELQDEALDWGDMTAEQALSFMDRAYRQGWDKAMASVPNPNYSQAEVDRSYQAGLTREKEEHTTLEQDIVATWAKHGLRIVRETVIGSKIVAERVK